VAVLEPGAVGLKNLADTSVPDSVKAELSATLATGNDVVVPTKPVILDGRAQVAWWRFDPTSGELIGVMPGGRGQALYEYVWPVVSTALCLRNEVNNEAEEGPHGPGRAVFVLCLMAVGGFAGGYAAGNALDTGAAYIAGMHPQLWVLADLIVTGGFLAAG